METQQGRSAIVVGEVVDLNDPEKYGRVKVSFPHLNGEQSDWSWLVTPMAGKQRGFFFQPEVGDQVLVALHHNDARFAYVLGSMWSAADQPPPGDGQIEQNNWRFITSRSGHVIKFDDTDGQERVEIVDKDGARKVVIDSANRKIEVVADSGDVSVSARSGNVTIEASTVSVKSTGNLTLEAQGDLKIKGAKVDIN